MGRSHAWVYRGDELVEARPMNWGNNLTMVGAMRQDRWRSVSCTGSAGRWRRACIAGTSFCSTTSVLTKITDSGA